MFGTILERVRMPIGVAGSAGPARALFVREPSRGIRISLASLLGSKIDAARQTPRDFLTWLAQQLPHNAIDILPALDSSREVIISTSIRIAVMASTILSNPVGGSHRHQPVADPAPGDLEVEHPASGGGFGGGRRPDLSERVLKLGLAHLRTALDATRFRTAIKLLFSRPACMTRPRPGCLPALSGRPGSIPAAHAAAAFAAAARADMRLAFTLLLVGLAACFLRSDLARFLLFSTWLSNLEAPASLRAIAMAWRRLLTLPPLPPRPLLSSPCLNSCMTRPVVFLWRGDVGIIWFLPVTFFFRRTNVS